MCKFTAVLTILYKILRNLICGDVGVYGNTGNKIKDAHRKRHAAESIGTFCAF